MTRTVLGLALRDLRHEPAQLLCILALIAGVLAPLMLIFSIKTGITDALVGRLLETPQTRLVSLTGNHALSPDFVAEIRGWPEVAFAVPNERSIARRMEMRAPGARVFERVTLDPSAPGDPLLPPGLVLGPEDIAVSASLANRTGLEPGSVLEARGTRGEPPNARLGITFTVRAVLPRGWLAGDAALVSAATLSELEAFYDGYALPARGVSEGHDLAGHAIAYENVRLYARDLESVAPLAERLELRSGAAVNDRTAEIVPLLSLSRHVDMALRVLAGCGSVGLAAALTALFWSNVERKRLTLAVLALMGTPPRALALFPLVQAAAYALGGSLAALLVFLGGATVFELLFAEGMSRLGGGAVVPVDPVQLGTICLGLLVIALAAALVALRRAAATDPAIAIRSGG